MDKNVEYSTLKQELIHLDNKKGNLVIALYTITITIFIFSIQVGNEWFFLISYIILFAFQGQMIAIREGSVRIAAYMAVFLEEGDGWESNFNEIFAETCLRAEQKVTYSKIVDMLTGRIAVEQLGLYCSVASICMCVYNNGITFYGIGSADFFDALCICLAIFLFVLIKLWCRNASKTMSIRNKYIENLKKYKQSRIQ